MLGIARIRASVRSFRDGNDRNVPLGPEAAFFRLFLILLDESSVLINAGPLAVMIQSLARKHASLLVVQQ